MLKPLVGDPVNGLVLPFQLEGTLLPPADVEDGTVVARDFLDFMLGQFGRFIEARRIGEKAPHDLRRVIEVPSPGLSMVDWP